MHHIDLQKKSRYVFGIEINNNVTYLGVFAIPVDILVNVEEK